MQKRRTRKGKNNKGFPSESILAVGFGICILGLAAINLFWPDHEMSEQENRMLASKPKLSVSSVLSGDYMEKYEHLKLMYEGIGLPVFDDEMQMLVEKLYDGVAAHQ